MEIGILSDSHDLQDNRHQDNVSKAAGLLARRGVRALIRAGCETGRATVAVVDLEAMQAELLAL
jgi:hypothetical protein